MSEPNDHLQPSGLGLHGNDQIAESAPAQPQTSQETSAHIARTQVNATYEPESQANPYERTHKDTQDLQGYHTAWQQYYQQYYQRYYLQQLHVQRQQQAHDRASQAAAHPATTSDIVTGTNQEPAQNTVAQQLRQDLRNKVTERAKKVRASHHFVPIISALVVGFVFIFLQYNRLFIAQVKAYVSPGTVVNETDTVLVDPTANSNVGPEPKLIIPKISVDVPVVYDVNSLEDGPVQAALTRGVVQYKLPGANSVPGQAGDTVILGHSSNDFFDPGNYKFAFVLLDRLEKGDVFYLHYQGKRYIYRVNDKKIISPTEFNVLQLGNDKPYATLVTCTPPGTALKRLVVISEQISPDPNAVQPIAPNAAPANNQQPTIPGNSPTWLDRVYDFFF